MQNYQLLPRDTSNNLGQHINADSPICVIVFEISTDLNTGQDENASLSIVVTSFSSARIYTYYE